MTVVMGPEVVVGVEQLGAACTGDVPALVAAARASSVSFADDATLARVIELAGAARAAAGDQGGSWWLACASASLRAPAEIAQQDEAEIAAARFARALPQSAKAHGPLPPSYRWIVGAQAELAPGPAAIELARRNALTHLERLDAELTARAPSLRAQLEAPGLDAPRLEAIERALASYEAAAKLVRAAVRRVIDHVLARAGGDPSLEQAGLAALAELDEVALPTLRAHVAEGRRVAAGFAGMAATAKANVPPLAAGAPLAAGTPLAPAASMRSPEELEGAMRQAFEQAWASPSPQTRAAFEQAVRARYAAEVASIADPAEREAALAHYVTHAVAQLPPG
jgi:hypothetical protein